MKQDLHTVAQNPPKMGANNGVENALPNLNCDLMKKAEQKLLCHLKIALKFVLNHTGTNV